jgi:hypothetical protein
MQQPLTAVGIIREFAAKSEDFKRMARNIAGEDADDLFQEVALMILEFKEERLIGYYNPTQGLKPIFLRMLCNQYRSKTSKFHKDYRKQEQFIQSKGSDIAYNDQTTELEEFNVDYNEMLTAVDNVSRMNGELFPCELETMIFELYTETGSLRKTLAAIHEDHKGKFDLKTVHEIVKKFRRTIKAHFNINN